MSVVTNIVVCYRVTDERMLAAVNKFFEERDYDKGLVRCDDESLPKHWYGGNKYLEAEILIGAFNCLNASDFISHMRSLPWERPQAVQIFIREEDDERFRLVNVVE